MCRTGLASLLLQMPSVQPGLKTVPFQWSNVVREFENKFKETFSNFDKKAHFNNVPEELKVVDGAKQVWCTLLAIDAIISLLTVKSFKKCVRRAFNQDRVLFDCIMKELQSVDVDAYAEIMTKKSFSSVQDSKSSNTESYLISLNKLDEPWSSLEELLNSMSATPHSKAKAKYVSTVGYLTSHPVLSGFNFNFTSIIHSVILRVLFELPVPMEIYLTPASSSESAGDLSADAKQKRKRGKRTPCEKTRKSGGVMPKTPSFITAQMAKNNANCVSPPQQLKMDHPVDLDRDIISSMGFDMDDFMFDEESCEDLLASTYDTSSSHSSPVVSSHPTVITPPTTSVSVVSATQTPPKVQEKVETVSSEDEMLQDYFDSPDDWFDDMDCFGDADTTTAATVTTAQDMNKVVPRMPQMSVNKALNITTSNTTQVPSQPPQFKRFTTEECDLLLGMTDDDDVVNEAPRVGNYTQQYPATGCVSYPDTFFFDAQYHPCDDEERLDFPLVSGILSKNPTPRHFVCKPCTPRVNMSSINNMPKATPRVMPAAAMCIPTLLRGMTLEEKDEK